MKFHDVNYTVKGDAPSARYDCSALEICSKRTPLSAEILVLAGMVRGGANAQRDEYFMDVHLLKVTVSTEKWGLAESSAYTLEWSVLKCTGSIPSKRSGAAATLLSDKNIMVVFGGGTLWTDDRVQNDVHCYDLASRNWKRQEVGGPLPPRRQGHAALALNSVASNILYIGGSNNEHNFDDLFVLHTETWQFSKLHVGSCPFSNLAGLTVTPCLNVSKKEAFIFGGASWQNLVASVSNDIFLVDFSGVGLEWKQYTTPRTSKKKGTKGSVWPHSRFAHGACFIDDEHLLVHGGWGFCDTEEIGGEEEIFFDDYHLYNTTKKTWSVVQNADGSRVSGQKRFGHNLLCLHNLGIVLGMFGSNGLHPLDDTFLVSFQSPRLLAARDVFCKHNLTTCCLPPAALSDSRTVDVFSGGTTGLLEDYYRPDSAVQQFCHLLQSGVLSDVTLRVSSTGAAYIGGEEPENEARTFRAHKCILASRSPVFEAMFSSSFKEANVTDIPIPDTSPPAFEVFLRCVYGAAAQDELSAEVLEDVLDLANRFQVLSLKYDCEICLCMRISSCNVVSVLGYADLYACPYVLRRCIEVIRGATCQQIIEEIKLKYPSLYQDIFSRIFCDTCLSSFIDESDIGKKRNYSRRKTAERAS